MSRSENCDCSDPDGVCSACWASIEATEREVESLRAEVARLTKGKQGESCNVTACQKPKSAHHYNKPMRAWYCIECATKIEAAANRHGDSFYDDL